MMDNPNRPAAMARAAGVNGLLYRSVRSEGGECIALFRPPATSSVKQTKHYVCIFDGDRFTGSPVTVSLDASYRSYSGITLRQ